MLEADSVQKQFYNALKENKDAFTASIIDVYTGDQALQTCEPRLVIQEALKAAVLKLPINKALGFSYIVVYNNSKRDNNGQWVKIPTPNFCCRLQRLHSNGDAHGAIPNNQRGRSL